VKDMTARVYQFFRTQNYVTFCLEIYTTLILKITVGNVILFVQTDSLHHIMERFWSREEMANKILTKEEKACEKHFELNTRTLETGHYEVRLPLSDNADKLGDSYDIAKAKFLTLEQYLHNHN
jgi:hypothetical protein